MHHRQDHWFAPETPHTNLVWSRSDDGWTRLAVTLDGADRGHVSSALDPDRAARRRWEPGAVESEPYETVIHRLDSEATQGVAANDNPHEDTRGLDPVTMRGRRYTPGGDPDGADGADGISGLTVPPIGISRSRDGLLLDIPLDRATVTPDGEGVDRTRVYGLGEKTGSLDKRGRTWVMWNSDDPTHTPDKSALYQSLAVAYLWTPAGTVTLFVDSMATIWFDVGEAQPERMLVEVYDDRFDLYLRRDDDLPTAVEHYTALTGRIPLPPEWSLGFQQCRYSYFPASRVRDVADRFRAERIPCDVLYLDIHYMDGYRVFTWDRERFPDPARLLAQLREAGFRVVTIVDPGVKTDVDYAVFSSGLERDVFLRRPGGELYVGRVWPGEAAFPDFSRAATREWWAEHHRSLLDVGVAGIWNDMNEPADFSGDETLRVDFTAPDNLVVNNDGDPCSLGRVHNEYATGMNRSTREALARFRPEERGFVLTRAGAAGVQRYATVWTGDNHSWWEHLAMMVPMFCNVGLSGAPFVGGDAGGFQLNADGELYARWIAAAAFTPFFRAHSALDTRDHEPWSFGPEVLEIARRFVGLRYRLLPYIYTLFEEASRTGAPVMRPLVWEFPDDPRVSRRGDSFLLGEGLLVAPVREPGVQERSVYLPAGIWYDFWTGERLEIPRRPDGSGRAVTAEAPLDSIPLYVRGGVVLPYERVRQHTGEAGDGVLRLLVAPDAEGGARGEVYGDAGEGFGYRRGEYRRISFSWTGNRLSLEDGARGVGGADRSRWRRYAVVPVALVQAEESDNPGESLLDGPVREQRDLS